MDITATSRYIRISPRKMRLVADAVVSLSLTDARSQLRFLEQRAAGVLGKTLESCIANAAHNAKIAEEDLLIKSIHVNEGTSFKRFRPVARGMAHGYKKRTSHVTVILTSKPKRAVVQSLPVKQDVTEKKIVKGVRSHGTKSKS